LNDPVTQLPGQEHFLGTLTSLLGAGPGPEHSGAILLIDLDSFRTVRDTYGYPVAHDLLRIAGTKLATAVRKTDTLSHLGGDEFAVLTTGFTDASELYTLVHRILGLFNTTWEALGHEFFMTASMGVAVFPDGDTTVWDLWRNAASALARAKAQGKNQFLVYRHGWNERLIQRHTLEVELRHAIDRSELELFYQPQVDPAGHVLGFEALLRWRHPTQGLLSPAAFLELAEETGLWLPLGEWVLAQACQQVRTWLDQGLPGVSLAVNVSANQLQQPGFLHLVKRSLDRAQLHPSVLEIEITEGSVVKAMQSSVHTLQLLRHMGVRVALDDFGTGYSSLSYLKDLPVDVLKIDRSFVEAIGRSRKSDAVLGAVLILAESLALTVVAEGVETFDQFDFLNERTCDRFQGYLFSRPLPAAEATALLAAGPITVARDASDSYTI